MTVTAKDQYIDSQTENSQKTIQKLERLKKLQQQTMKLQTNILAQSSDIQSLLDQTKNTTHIAPPTVLGSEVQSLLDQPQTTFQIPPPTVISSESQSRNISFISPGDQELIDFHQIGTKNDDIQSKFQSQPNNILNLAQHGLKKLLNDQKLKQNELQSQKSSQTMTTIQKYLQNRTSKQNSQREQNQQVNDSTIGGRTDGNQIDRGISTGDFIKDNVSQSILSKLNVKILEKKKQPRAQTAVARQKSEPLSQDKQLKAQKSHKTKPRKRNIQSATTQKKNYQIGGRLDTHGDLVANRSQKILLPQIDRSNSASKKKSLNNSQDPIQLISQKISKMNSFRNQRKSFNNFSKTDKQFQGDSYSQLQLPSIQKVNLSKLNKKQTDQNINDYSASIFETHNQSRAQSQNIVKQSTSKNKPIFDELGNFAYDGILRKPKWALPEEILKSDNQENTNSRIRIEDPFTRYTEKETNNVWKTIKDEDIAKYLLGTQYLSRQKIDTKAIILTEPSLVKLDLFLNEQLYNLPEKKSEIQKFYKKIQHDRMSSKSQKLELEKKNQKMTEYFCLMKSEIIRQNENEFVKQSKFPSFPDWDSNIKADSHFFLNLDQCQKNKQFLKVYKPSECVKLDHQTVRKKLRKLSPDGGLFDDEQFKRFNNKSRFDSWLLSARDEKQVDTSEIDIMPKTMMSSIISETKIVRIEEKKIEKSPSLQPVKQQSPTDNGLLTILAQQSAANPSLQLGSKQVSVANHESQQFSEDKKEITFLENNMKSIGLMSPIMSPNFTILDQSFESDKNLVSLIGRNSLRKVQADLEKTIFIPHGFDHQSVEEIIKNMIPYKKVAPPTKEMKYKMYLMKQNLETERIKQELTQDKAFKAEIPQGIQNNILDDKKWLKLERTSERYFRSVYKIANPDFFSYIFSNTSKDPEQIERNSLQLKIMNEFERIQQQIFKFSLLQDSSFGAAQDQTDYADRMHFQKNVCMTEGINPENMKNSDVFLKYYQRNIRMMIKDRDTSILINPNILRFWHHSKTVSELWKVLMDQNLNFQQNFDLYRQWYTDWIVMQSKKNKGEDIGGGFLRVKKWYETMSSRQQEVVWAKKEKLLPKHTSYGELQKFIYRGKWRNILDKKEGLIKDYSEFKQQFKFLMTQFEYKIGKIDSQMKLGNDKLSVSHLFFFYSLPIDDEQKGLLQTVCEINDEDYNFPIERKFNDVVFRARLRNTEQIRTVKESYLPPFEYFECIYSLDKEFQDKKVLHPVLNHLIKVRVNAQYKQLIKIIGFRKQLLLFRQEQYQKKNIDAFYKYHKQQNKIKKIIRSRSQGSLPMEEQMPFRKRQNAMDKMYTMCMYLTIPKALPEQSEQPKELTEINQITQSNEQSERIQNQQSERVQNQLSPQIHNEGGQRVQKKAGRQIQKKLGRHIQKEGGNQLSEVEEEKSVIDSSYQDVILQTHELDYIKYETLGGSILPYTDDFLEEPNLQKLELIYRYKTQFKPITKPYIDHLYTEELESLLKEYEWNMAVARWTYTQKLKPSEKPKYLYVNLYSKEKEEERSRQHDCRFLRWLEECLDDQRYQDFKTYEDDTIKMSDNKKQFLNLLETRAIKSIIHLKTENFFYQYFFRHKNNQDSKPDEDPHIIFPKYYALFMTKSMIGQVKKTKTFGPLHFIKKKIIKNQIKLPGLEIDDVSSGVNLSDIGSPSKRFLQKLSSSAQVQEYADRQLRKEIRLAVLSGNISLVTNYLQMFARSFKDRPQNLQDYQNPNTGNTLLHEALLFNFTTRQNLSITNEVELFSKDKKKVVIEEEEDKQSVRIKSQLVGLLVGDGMCSVTKQNNEGITAQDIAKAIGDEVRQQIQSID